MLAELGRMGLKTRAPWRAATDTGRWERLGAVGVSQRGKATERLGKVKRAAARIILTAPDDWGRDTVGHWLRLGPHPADD